MRGVIGASHKFRYMVLTVAVGLMVLSISQLRGMPVDVLPEFGPPLVQIQTESLGLSAQEVEQLITVPLEQDLLNGVPWLETIHSESVPGVSSITLVFKPGTDLMRARQMVSERMTQAVALPHVSTPPTILQPTSATSRVMIVGLSAKNLSLIQLGVLAHWTLAPRLMGVPGVANVSIWGERNRQLQVLVDPVRLLAQKVPLVSVLETTGNALWVSTLSFVEASSPGTGGFVDTPNQRLGVRHISPIVTADGLAQVPISDTKKSDGTPLRLSDVATIVEDHQPLIGDAVVGDGSGLLLVVEKFPGANTLEVTRGVETAIDQMRPGLGGATIDSTVYRPANFIERAIGNLSLALLLGYALVVLVLFAFFQNWRMALISAVVIPLSLVSATLVLFLTGQTMNAILLAGLLLAVGVVVDDAIIDVDHLARHLSRSRADGSIRSTARIALAGALEIRGAVLFAAVITAVIIVPLVVTGGVVGTFLNPLALAYLLAIAASVLVALTVTPALCMVLLSGPSVGRREFQLLTRVKQGYAGLLARFIRRPRLALVGVVVLGVIGLAGVPFVRPSLLPAFKEGDLLIHVAAMPGTSQPEMIRIVGLVSRELRSVPGVRDVAAQTGRAIRGDDVVGVNSGQIWVSLDPAADYDKTFATIQHVVKGYPGFRLDVGTYVKDATRAVGAPSSNAVVVRVYGDTDEVLLAQARNVQKAIAGVAGIADARVNVPVQELTLETEVDLTAAQRYGIKPGDVRRTAATMLAGIVVGNLFEEQKIFDVVVWSTPETRHSIDSIGNLLIDTPDGGQVRLRDVARVRIVPTSSVIRHEAVKRYFDVVATVRGRDLGAVAADVKTIVRQVPFPLEYHAEVLGDYAAQQDARVRLVGLIVALLIGILFLLQAVLGSWRLAALAFLTMPLALVGGLLASLASGGVMTLGSLAGFVLVLGITARHGIVLITHYQRLVRDEGVPFGAPAVARGSVERLSPLVLTAVATGLAFVPSLFLGDLPGLEIVRPMAVVVLGGLVTSVGLSLFLVPALYQGLAVEPERERERDHVDGVSPVTVLGTN